MHQSSRRWQSITLGLAVLQSRAGILLALEVEEACSLQSSRMANCGLQRGAVHMRYNSMNDSTMTAVERDLSIPRECARTVLTNSDGGVSDCQQHRHATCGCARALFVQENANARTSVRMKREQNSRGHQSQHHSVTHACMHAGHNKRGIQAYVTKTAPQKQPWVAVR